MRVTLHCSAGNPMLSPVLSGGWSPKVARDNHAPGHVPACETATRTSSRSALPRTARVGGGLASACSRIPSSRLSTLGRGLCVAGGPLYRRPLLLSTPRLPDLCGPILLRVRRATVL